MATETVMAAAASIPRWPPNTSQEYITARNDLLKEEWVLRDQIERVASLRRALPQGAIMPEYIFTEGPSDLASNEPVKQTTLKDLASDGRSLVTYHLMFDPADDEACSMCSMIVDSFNGVAHHIAQNINFVIIGKAPLPVLRAWATKRGWTRLRILSSYESEFNKDMGFENPSWAKDEKQLPGISVFKADGEGEVRHVYTARASIEPGSERGLDLLGCVYNVMDLTPEGRGNWYAGNEYI